MKFLCVSCDEQMKIKGTRGPDEGSVTVLFQCPGCGWEVGMLTNPHETQLVQSLNVKIGPQKKEAASPSCPVIPDNSFSTVQWTPEAKERLQRVPTFVREMARMGVEQFASEHGYELITEDVMTAARAERGM
ncbi:MAG: PCP reductase family protein [bacterium]